MQDLAALKDDLLQALLELTSNPNPDALHDFRVSVRRFLSNAQLGKADKKPLKQIFRLSSPLRDIDTLVSKMGELGSEFDAIKELLATNNISNYDELLKSIDELDIEGCIQNADTADYEQDESTTISDDFGHFSKRLLELVKEDALADKEELHTLRKKLKKIRYRFEHNKKVPVAEAITSFKQLQDALGHINDRHAWLSVLDGKEFEHLHSVKSLKKLLKQEEEDATEALKTMFSEEFCELLKHKISAQQ